MATGTYSIEEVRLGSGPTPPTAPAPPPPGPRVKAWHVFSTVILPVATILIEMTTGMCAESFFNPLPNLLAIALAWMVPAAGLLNALRLDHPWFGSGRVLATLNGAAIGISAMYAIAFLPLVPMALLALLFAIGLLPLTPLIALHGSLGQRREWLIADPAAPSLRRGLLAGSLAVLAAAVQPLMTDVWLKRAAAGPEAGRADAVRMLRTFGDRGALDLACRGRRDTLWHDGVDPTAAQRVYFLVTGQPYEQQPRLNRRGWEWDEAQATQSVGRKLAGLSLATSSISGKVDAAMGTQYHEWTLEFANASPQPKEARGTIVLPESGVVSRVTLWVDGEEREAAFGSRTSTRAAYQSVVSTQRDPLLVQTAGPGRAMFQCFPVPANGLMRIRLGVTAPLRAGRVELPYLIDSNFRFEAMKHPVDIDGAGDDRALTSEQLRHPLESPAAPAAETVSAADPWLPRERITRRLIAAPRPTRLAVVVDGSVSMRPYRDRIRAAAERARKSMPVDLIETDDFRGGSDNVPYLEQAQKQLAGTGGALVWLHGPQPLDLTSVTRLRNSKVALYAAQLADGPNPVLAKLEEWPRVHGIRVTADDWADRFLDGSIEYEWTRDAGPAPPSIDLARLWALSEVDRLSPRDPVKASRLASEYRLVTRHTGAVVLERREQYTPFGLDPSVNQPTAAVPEPAPILLVGASLILLFLCKRRTNRPATS